MVRIKTVVAWLILLAVPLGAARGEPPPSTVDATGLRQRLPGLLEELDSPRFDVRQRAAGEIESHMARPEMGRVLAEEFSRRLLDPRLSYEVRWRLERWVQRLPAAKVAPTGPARDAELDRLVGQLDDDDYGARVGAARRLEWLAEDPRSVSRVLVRLKSYLAAPGRSEEARQRLEPLREKVRGRWLATDPRLWTLPPVGDEQIRRWLDELAQPADGPGAEARWSRAQQELLDLLARDAEVPRVAGALRQQLEGLLDREAAARLDAVLEWTRPALVAEYWQERHHRGEQHLIVGEPSQAEGAVRPSHFDRVDDRVAHCVSGNTLSPGDYPSGVAFLHPIRDDAFFCIVNLPTPRQRMAYGYLVQRDEAERLREITQRTLARWKEEIRPIGDRELKLLAVVDAREASRYVAGVLAAPPPPRPNGAPDLLPRLDRPSAPIEPELLAEFLADQGTADAIPDLQKALAAAKMRRPSESMGQAMWAAALAIATRDPWPEVDAWLAGLLERSDPLGDDGGRLGPTAAGLLLVRHGQSANSYGLVATGPLRPIAVPGRRSILSAYRYAGADSVEKVRLWWNATRSKAAAKPGQHSPSTRECVWRES